LIPESRLPAYCDVRPRPLCAYVGHSLDRTEFGKADIAFRSRNGMLVNGSVGYDEPVSGVVFIKGEQFVVASLPFAALKIARQSLQSCFGVFDGPKGRTAGSDALSR
jgi:hypothetical protein